MFDEKTNDKNTLISSETNTVLDDTTMSDDFNFIISSDTILSNELNSDVVYIEKDNRCLLISEKNNKVFLPYKISEIKSYLEQYPDEYYSLSDVVNKEYILSLTYFIKHPSIARFREAYSLSRDREAKPIMESIKYAMDLMFKGNLNPAIIAACKTQEQLSNYLDCLDSNTLYKFTDFDILFEVNPI